MRTGFDFNLLFGWKGNVSFSSKLWYIDADHEKRLIFFYFGKAMPLTKDVVAFNIVFLWLHLAIGYLKVSE